jgi:ribosome biogenesis GTPase
MLSVSLAEGLVFRKSQGRYAVQLDPSPGAGPARVVDCELSNKLHKELVYPIADPNSFRRRVMEVVDIRQVDPVAVGDLVRFVPAGPDTGMIVEVLPRRSKLVRRAAGPKPLEQVVVANVDQLVAIVAGALPAPSWELLDRYLVGAEATELPSVIVVTKMDLVDDDPDLETELGEHERIGYRVIRTSATSRRGVDELGEALSGRVSVFAGRSGVGKTTLLNCLQPGLGLRVAEVSGSTGKGRHTTTMLEMFPLDGGGAIVDTPGMREFGLWDVAGSEVAELFREIAPLLGRCRFGADCSHTHEPKCAVKTAVERGEVSERRYRSMLRLAG